MAYEGSCSRCGGDLTTLKHPVRRLAFTRHWGTGFKSLFSRPLRACGSCGSIFSWEGELVAESALETEFELKLRGLKEDMGSLRDSFITVFLAGEFAAGWMVFGPGSFDPRAPLVAGILGAAALLPAGYFAKKAREFKKEMKRLRTERITSARQLK